MWTCPICHARLPLDDMVLCRTDGSHLCPACAATRDDATETTDLGWFIAIEAEILGPKGARCTRTVARPRRQRRATAPVWRVAVRGRTGER